MKFLESDVPALTNLGGPGILHEGILGPDRIVGKARLHPGDRPAPRIDDFRQTIAWSKGPLALRIRRALKINERVPQPTMFKGSNLQWLGDDGSLETAREYGSSLIQEMLDSGKIIYNE